MSREEVKNKILLATIDCIEEYGLAKVTIRKISQLAGVNVAMINYYFGSKDKLIEKAMQATLQEGFSNNLEDYSTQWETDTITALKGFLYDTLSGMMNYPNITKSHLYEVMINNNYNCLSVMELNNFLDKLYDLTKEIVIGKDEREKRRAVVQMFSAVFLIGLIPYIFNTYLGYDIEDKNERKLFIDTLVSKFTNQL
jgi:AcrR family transcriptional regulator